MRGLRLFLTGRWYRPVFFLFLLEARGVGGLPLRCPVSATGRVRHLPSALCQLRSHLMRALPNVRPARKRLNADVADAARSILLVSYAECHSAYCLRKFPIFSPQNLHIPFFITIFALDLLHCSILLVRD